MCLVSSVALAVTFFSPLALQGTQPEDLKKTTAEALAKFEYPGSKRKHDHNIGTMCQFVLISTDELKKVNEWYRKKLGIHKMLTGISTQPWPLGSSIGEGKGVQQVTYFDDGVRWEGNQFTKVILRPATTKSFVMHNPDFTLMVVLNRAQADKSTMVSLVYLPAVKK